MGGDGCNGVANAQADANRPALPGRMLCVLLQTSYRQSTMRPSASSDASTSVIMAGGEGLPGVFLFAHPLHAHRLARYRTRHQGGVRGGVVRPLCP